MKKSVLTACLVFLTGVLSSQAVVIGWAAENVLPGTQYASLVYVADGDAPTITDNVWSPGAESLAWNVNAFEGTSLMPQETTDATTRSGAGAYYVVLFNYTLGQYAVSTSALAWNNAAAISTSEFDIITDYFTPSAFSAWTAVPEPSTAMLLMVGAAVAALRRRKHV
jgi:hypothetical protein